MKKLMLFFAILIFVGCVSSCKKRNIGKQIKTLKVQGDHPRLSSASHGELAVRAVGDVVVLTSGASGVIRNISHGFGGNHEYTIALNDDEASDIVVYSNDLL